MTQDHQTDKKIKVGPKGRWAKIPQGWFVVINDVCKTKDMFANTQTASFEPVEEDDIGMPADTFDCLIRKEKS